jgi:hypothetical protein
MMITVISLIFFTVALFLYFRDTSLHSCNNSSLFSLFFTLRFKADSWLHIAPVGCISGTKLDVLLLEIVTMLFYSFSDQDSQL